MHLKGLDLNLLVTLNVLLQEYSVSRTAERLHLSQPAVSAALARLREFFHDDLLVQHGRKMIPTPFAESLVPELKTIVGRIEALIEAPVDFDPSSTERVFRLMASDYITTVLLSPVIQQLHSLAPKVQLDLRMPSEQTMIEFDRGAIDLVITPEPYLRPGHPAELLFEERHVVVGWEGNNLLQQPLTERCFMQAGHVAVIMGPNRSASFTEGFLPRCLAARRIEVYAPSFTLVPWLLLGTTRLAVMQERLARAFANTLPLAIQPLPLEMPVMREMIQYHSVRENFQDLVWLRGLIQAEAAGQSEPGSGG